MNTVYASPEGGVDRFYCTWRNSDGDGLSCYVYGKAAVYAFAKKCHARNVVFCSL